MQLTLSNSNLSIFRTNLKSMIKNKPPSTSLNPIQAGLENCKLRKFLLRTRKKTEESKTG